MRQVILLLALLISLVFFSCSKHDETSPVHQPLNDLQNIQYGMAPDSGGMSVTLQMNIYFPDNATSSKKYPLVLMIHGGGFIQGDKDDVKTHCGILADSGFVAASINYRLGWKNGTGNCDGDTLSQRMAIYRVIQDVNAALRFLISNAAGYAIDTDHIFVGGPSAGAVSSLMTTYIDNTIAQQIAPVEYNVLGPVNTSGNSFTGTFTIKGIVHLWGSLPDSNLINSYSAVPMISFHGTSDKVVPCDIGYMQDCSNYPVQFGSACLTRQLHTAAEPYALYLKTGGGHGPDLYSPSYTMSRAASFFKSIIHDTPITGKVWVD